jgi:anhydro-N-acetylmuramic acid kinase
MATAGPALVVLGLMSGTSGDAIDAVIARVPAAPTLTALRDVTLYQRPYAPAERAALFALFDTERSTVRDVCRLSFLAGEWFAAAALEALAAAGLSPDDVDLIASHGQTIYHCPPAADGAGHTGAASDEPAAGVACTLQIGEPAVIAERTGVTTVADFRVRDVAAGGQGAPLVSYVDALLFGDPAETRAVLNLGGIANLTLLPPAASGAAPLAFDTGPANMVLDWLAGELSGGTQRFDAGGRMAAAGRADELLLGALLEHPYFAAPPPKTTGRELFGAEYARAFWECCRSAALRPADAMATAVALTAESVARGLRLAEAALSRRAAGDGGSAESAPVGPVREVIAGGGGTRNPALMAELARRLPGVRLTSHEAYGVSSQAKEALSFAVLGSAAVRGQANTLPSCTGARHAVVMGKIVPGRNYPTLMRRLFGPPA